MLAFSSRGSLWNPQLFESGSSRIPCCFAHFEIFVCVSFVASVRCLPLSISSSVIPAHSRLSLSDIWCNLLMVLHACIALGTLLVVTTLATIALLLKK